MHNRCTNTKVAHPSHITAGITPLKMSFLRLAARCRLQRCRRPFDCWIDWVCVLPSGEAKGVIAVGA